MLLGALLLFVGVAMLLSDLWKSAPETETTTAKPVLVASEDLQVGQSGNELVANSLASAVELEDAPTGSLGDLSELIGVVLAKPIPKGEPITFEALRMPTAREAASVIVPEDTEGVALTVPFTAGGAGYVGAGDRINLYSVIDHNNDTHLMLLGTNVLVLDISKEVAPYVAEGPRPESTSLTFLLALEPEVAEAVLLFANTGSFHFTLSTSEENRPRLVESLDHLFDSILNETSQTAAMDVGRP